MSRINEENRIWGAATFSNSFDQRSVFAYYGRRFDHPHLPVFAKVYGGLLYGYRGEYQDKIPLNGVGVAPAIVPSAGIQLGTFQSEFVLLGGAAFMINVGWRM